MHIARFVTIGCALVALLSACGAERPLRAPAPTPISSEDHPLCELRVDGNRVVSPSGQPALLYGAALPSLQVMAASDYPAEERLRDLAAAGASVVRLAIDESELTPTYVPAQLQPFAQQAHALGMLVVLGWDDTIRPPVNDTLDLAEDWIRLAVTYVSNAPGVWFELYTTTQDLSPLRARNSALRLIDVARGFRANNIVIVNDPIWLRESDPALNAPLPGAGILYGVAAPAGLMQAGPSAGYDFARAPFIVTRWEPDANAADDLARFKSMEVGAIASGIMDARDTIPSVVSAFWQANKMDWEGCR